MSSNVYSSRPWLLVYSDCDVQHAEYNDAKEALKAFDNASQQWTCSLYRLVGRSGTMPDQKPVTVTNHPKLLHQPDFGIPRDIIAAADKLASYFAQRGIQNWQLGGVRSVRYD
jgi:hypothetical protein